MSVQSGSSIAPTDGRRLFDILAAVDYLRSIGADGATKNFVRGLIASGAVPHVRIGKKFYIDRESLHGWILKHQRRAQ
jgi:excisionase family DNA binding protein